MGRFCPIYCIKLMPKVILIVFHRLPLVNYPNKAYFCNNKFFNLKVK